MIGIVNEIGDIIVLYKSAEAISADWAAFFAAAKSRLAAMDRKPQNAKTILDFVNTFNREYAEMSKLEKRSERFRRSLTRGGRA